MASIMIKVAGEGAITKAHRTADVGPTSGSSVVYEIQNVPEGVSLEDVSALIPRLELLVIEVAGLVFVALVCWRHLADFWRKRKTRRHRGTA